MKYLRSRYYSALKLLEDYNYPTPFPIFSKQFFRQHKKYGSKDRKAITDICYNYFRHGLGLKSMSKKHGLLWSLLAFNIKDLQVWTDLAKELEFSSDIGQFYDLESSRSIDEAYQRISTSFYKEGFLMPEFEHYNGAQNKGYRPKIWAKDHLDNLPGKLGIIGAKAIKSNLSIPESIQIQDLSSQFLCSKITVQTEDKVWDVCSGAGGKSMNLLYRQKGTFYLSDIRSSILNNAQSRIHKMGYKAYFGESDLSKNQPLVFKNKGRVQRSFFDVILLDVPCSGSGTWFRSPEHFTNFDYTLLKEYVSRQKAIVKNAFPFLKKGGMLYYLTCSIFEMENAQVTHWIIDNFDVEPIEDICFDGIKHHADGMYFASFKKRNN